MLTFIAPIIFINVGNSFFKHCFNVGFNLVHRSLKMHEYRHGDCHGYLVMDKNNVMTRY